MLNMEKFVEKIFFYSHKNFFIFLSISNINLKKSFFLEHYGTIKGIIYPSYKIIFAKI